jgi:hypothetical protein
MGETREGLGEMADPADLVTALVQVGLLKRAFTTGCSDAGGLLVIDGVLGRSVRR